MRVLWLCNCLLSDSDTGATGSWLDSLARGLLDANAVELGNITFGPVKVFTQRNFQRVNQWLVPGGVPLGRDGLPPVSLVKAIVEAVKEFSPDLIHVWGTEAFWGLLPSRNLLAYPSLLEIQGLKSQIAKVFFGGMSGAERRRSIGLKELLKRRTMHAEQRDYERWGAREEEIIRGHRFVSVQTAWAESQIKAINPAACLFHVELALRRAFSEAANWQPPPKPVVFCSAAYSSPFKGMHVAIRAFALLKKRMPEVRLRIAGMHQRSGIRQDGYMRWLNQIISNLGLMNAIEWLGPLHAEQIVSELKQASAQVIPTFIENCCTSMQEAMAVGTPIVASYVGGIPSLAKDEESCLFFPPGDEAMCAQQLERLLNNRDLAMHLSRESRKIAAVRNDRQRIVEKQLDIYRQILSQGR